MSIVISALKTLVLMIIPGIILGIYLYLKEVQGPYYLGGNSDPEYAYLFNSLDLAHGVVPGHVDHPGTPVQWLGATSIHLLHAVSGKDTLDEDVIARPELYLSFINQVLLVINLLVIWMTGWIVSRWASLSTAILVQFSPMISVEVLQSLIRVSPEPLLISITMLYICLLVSVLHNNNLHRRKDFYLVLFAFICAVGLSTKLTFLPLLCLPAILIPQWKNKAFMLLVFGLVFVLVTLPALFNLNYFSDWIKNLALRSGRYGSGPATVIDKKSFFTNIQFIIAYEPLFIISSGLLVLLASLFLIPRVRKKFRGTEIFLLTTGVLVAICAQIAIVAKHFAIHYMIPAFVLSVVGVLIFQKALSYLLPRSSKLIDPACTIIFLFALGWRLSISLPQKHQELLSSKENQSEVCDYVASNFPSATKVYYYRASSLPFALSFGLSFSGDRRYQYTNILKLQHPRTYTYNIFNGQYYEWIFDKKIHDIIKPDQYPVIFQGSKVDKVLPVFYPGEHDKAIMTPVLVEKFVAHAEAVYEAKGITSVSAR